jgi:hypothetical protein
VKLSYAERQRFLLATRFFDYTSEPVLRFIKEHDMKKHANETDLGFAWRALVTVRNALRYVVPSGNELSFSATAASERGTGECLSSQSLFTAILRYNKIPAKNLGGWHSPDGADSDQKKAGDPHSQTAFWIDGIGWVPADSTAHVDKAPTDQENMWMFGCHTAEMFYIHEDLDFLLPMLNDDKPMLEAWFHGGLIPFDAQHHAYWTNWSRKERIRATTVKMLNDGWRAKQKVK